MRVGKAHDPRCGSGAGGGAGFGVAWAGSGCGCRVELGRLFWLAASASVGDLDLVFEVTEAWPGAAADASCLGHALPYTDAHGVESFTQLEEQEQDSGGRPRAAHRVGRAPGRDDRELRYIIEGEVLQRCRQGCAKE
ncbi:hypothetical protein GALMADRAFT_208993 [Galerina marginata CBS 339.88]|uniref:Uncharacterized protein n=1 Tax=Galerina marginata (strain CBS 339.88) TaxID=685588 RepID=A0A067THP8_GALM3|nr:hypothetical protein GALMADRAFT_208993 [Galerina marginata CBS 339.88]